MKTSVFISFIHNDSCVCSQRVFFLTHGSTHEGKIQENQSTFYFSNPKPLSKLYIPKVVGKKRFSRLFLAFFQRRKKTDHILYYTYM